MKIITNQRKIRIAITEINRLGRFDKKLPKKSITLYDTNDGTVDFVYKEIVKLLEKLEDK